MAFYRGLQGCINSRKNKDCVVTATRPNARAQNFPALEVFAAYVESFEKNKRMVETVIYFWQCISPYLTLRRLMSYIYGAPILDVSRSHTTTQHSR